jgi:hypothetical protein
MEQPRQPSHEQDAPDDQGAQSDNFLFRYHFCFAQALCYIGLTM